MMSFRKHVGWSPPVLTAIASEGKGVAEILAAIDHHRDYLRSTGLLEARRKERLRRRIMELVAGRLHNEFWTDERRALLAGKLDDIWNSQTAPSAAAAELVRHFRQQSEGSSHGRERTSV
jgi:LAO/AO transport system kinase